MKTALTIAGSDPTCGAGAQLDLKVFHSTGVEGLSVITAITAQNTRGVRSIYPLPADMVRNQIDVLLEDVGVEALKTGMLCSPSVVDLVSRTIRDHGIGKVVVDPVIESSSGTALAEAGTVERMVETLFPAATAVTPNVPEASRLTGVEIRKISHLKEAARKIRAMGPSAVIITGGHLPAAGAAAGTEGRDAVLDLCYDGRDFKLMESERLPGEYHGTGCAFASALTAYLCLGASLSEAAEKAKEFVGVSIRRARFIGGGMGILGV